MGGHLVCLLIGKQRFERVLDIDGVFMTIEKGGFEEIQ
jgi:hypothetical protein